MLNWLIIDHNLRSIFSLKSMLFLSSAPILLNFQSKNSPEKCFMYRMMRSENPEVRHGP